MKSSNSRSPFSLRNRVSLQQRRCSGHASASEAPPPSEHHTSQILMRAPLPKIWQQRHNSKPVSTTAARRASERSHKKPWTVETKFKRRRLWNRTGRSLPVLSGLRLTVEEEWEKLWSGAAWRGNNWLNVWLRDCCMPHSSGRGHRGWESRGGAGGRRGWGGRSQGGEQRRPPLARADWTLYVVELNTRFLL